MCVEGGVVLPGLGGKIIHLYGSRLCRMLEGGDDLGKGNGVRRSGCDCPKDVWVTTVKG